MVLSPYNIRDKHSFTQDFYACSSLEGLGCKIVLCKKIP